LSWYVYVLPHMGVKGLAGRLDLTRAWDDESNRFVVETPIAQVVCPSLVATQGLRQRHATTYVGLAGVGRHAGNLPKDSRQAGVFGYERRTKLSDITDGASVTIMVCETLSENGPWAAGGRPTVRGVEPHLRPYVGSGLQFGGIHPKGTMVSFADGSVRFLYESIQADVSEALTTIHGREPVGTIDER
jgi:prepilin-type processing-associated H-X9-DG protein